MNGMNALRQRTARRAFWGRGLALLLRNATNYDTHALAAVALKRAAESGLPTALYLLGRHA